MNSLSTCNDLKKCMLCPRECGVDRFKSKGYCGEGAKVRIARAELHHWEEPCISGKNGSGTVFFSGCSLKCCFCQNYEISDKGKGFEISIEELADTFLMLQNKGAENINLVNPTHFTLQIIDALKMVKSKLKIPIVYNCGGYEKVETLEKLENYIDIFLPDLKYYDNKLSAKFSKADNYFQSASKAIKKMVEIVGKPQFDENQILKKGVIVRHLVLPNCRHDSIKLIEWLGNNFSNDEILISIMSQFTPVYKAFDFKELSRRTSTFEYNSVLDVAEKFNFNGFFQKRESATNDFIPEFYDHKYY